MEIKGNVGDEVYIKAKLNYIKIDNQGIKYFVTVPDSYLHGLKESEITFEMKQPLPKIESGRRQKRS